MSGENEIKKRSSYNASFKLKVVKYAEERNNCAAARNFHISESQVRQWRKKKLSLQEMPKTKKAARGRSSFFPELEKCLRDWVIERRKKGFRVKRTNIRRHALRLLKDDKFKATKPTMFVASTGWCSRFLNRFGLSLRTPTKKILNNKTRCKRKIHKPSRYSEDYYASFNDESVSFNDESVSFNDEPVSFNKEPVSFNKEPVSFNEEPVSFNEEPVSTTMKDTIKDSLEYHENSKEQQKINVYQEDLASLEAFYYSRKNAIKKLSKTQRKGNFKFKCLICKKIVENNIKMMKHINAHIDNQRQCKPALSDLTQCKYCFRDFKTPFSMQCHIETVHLKKDSLVCRICNREFVQFKKLLLHMKNLHIQSDMPYICQLCHYRSSFHQDIIEHFHKIHYGTDKVLCHYCLKIFHIKFSDVGVGFIQNYFYHLHKHQLKSLTKKCSRCCLIFLSIQELKEHQLKAHKSVAEHKGVQPIKSTVTPFKEKLAENSNKTYQASIVNTAEYEMRCKKPVKQSDHKADDVTIKNLNASKFKCWECDHPITFNHFGRFLKCGSCHYSTNCCKAFVDHMILKHSRLNRKRKNKGIDPKPTTLKKPMSCECGFTSLDGNSIAAHLVYCRKPSCQITSAKSMITVITQAEDGYWHVYKSKGRKSRYSIKKAKKNKNLKFSKSKQKIKNNRKQKIQTQSKRNNVKINGIIYAPLKIIRNDDKEIKSANNSENIIQNRFHHSEEMETEESLDMLNALGLICRSQSAVEDSFNCLKAITDDDKLDSLYYKAEEINELLNSCE